MLAVLGGILVCCGLHSDVDQLQYDTFADGELACCGLHSDVDQLQWCDGYCDTVPVVACTQT